MAGTNLTYHIPIGSVQTTSGNTPLTDAKPEKSGQVFKIGTPVQLNAGFVQAWDGATVTGGILGVALVPASNLGTNGKGAPGLFGQVGAPGTTLTFGNVAYTPGAINIPIGAPMTDGRTLFEVANGDIVWEAQFDNANGNVAADYTPTVATIGQYFGLSQDVSGQFYIDASKNTNGTNTVLQVVGINPLDVGNLANGNYGLNARLRFRFQSTARQLV